MGTLEELNRLAREVYGAKSFVKGESGLLACFADDKAGVVAEHVTAQVTPEDMRSLLLLEKLRRSAGFGELVEMLRDDGAESRLGAVNYDHALATLLELLGGNDGNG